MDRPSAAKLAITKAGDRIKNAVAASDAFFPFPDGPEILLNAGVTAIIGGVLIATSNTKVELRSTGVGPVGNVTPVKPRYWMGEF